MTTGFLLADEALPTVAEIAEVTVKGQHADTSLRG